MKNKNKSEFIVLFALTFFLILGSVFLFNKKENQLKNDTKVLGEEKSGPIINVFNSQNSEIYQKSDVISQTVFDDPAIYISVENNANPKTKIDVYKIGKDELVKFLVFNDKKERINKKIDIGDMEAVFSTSKDLVKNEVTRFDLPMEEKGVWLVRTYVDSISKDTVIIRSENGSIVKEGKNDFIFWTQNLKNKKRVSGVSLSIWSLEGKSKEMGSAVSQDNGVSTIPFDSRADVAVAEKDGDLALIPININTFNSEWTNDNFIQEKPFHRYFVFTDRSLYKPGDAINFKAILREDDDASLAVTKGRALVEMFDQENAWQENGKALFSQEFEISNDGTIFGEIKTKESFSTGAYVLKVKVVEPKKNNETPSRWMGDWEGEGNAYFDIEYYQKPEYNLKVESSADRVVVGDSINFNVKGEYFFGQPLANKKVKYKIRRENYYYDYYYDENNQNSEGDYWKYSYSYGEEFMSGEVELDSAGNGNIQVKAQEKRGSKGTENQIYTIEIDYADQSGIPVVAQSGVLVMSGNYRILTKYNENNYRAGDEISLLLKLVANKNSKISGVEMKAEIELSYYEKKEVDGHPHYENKKEKIPDISVKTDNNGEALVKFKAPKSGSYNIKVSGKDEKGNTINNSFYAWVSKGGESENSSGEQQGLTLTEGKSQYLPGEKVKISVDSQISDRDVFISFERNSVHHYEVINLSGNTGKIEFNAEDSDVPNIFVSASSFSENGLDTHQVNIEISPEDKKINYEIKTDKASYGPGENIQISVHTFDKEKKPISAESAIWVVDKAIFELTNKVDLSIFDSFWHSRGDLTQFSNSLKGIGESFGAEMGGCFSEGTKISMADGSLKNIEEIKDGEEILTRAGDNDMQLVKANVLGIQKNETEGFLVINGKLNITPDHILRVNKSWRTAGDIQIGDKLVGQDGQEISVESIEWNIGKYKTYNLEIGEYHTFFADGIYVHNEKGGGIDRSVFEDTAYWNPNIKTDKNGFAKVFFKLPDNLTTWVISSIGATEDGRVGEGSSEFIVSKDVVIKPIYPNILRIGDEISLAALVRNFTNQEQKFEVSLDFAEGEIANQIQEVSIKPKESEQVFWKVKPNIENSEAKIKFSAVNKGDKKLSDTVALSLPVEKFGYFESSSVAGNGEKSFDLKISPNTDKEKGTVELSLAPSLIGSLPSAMKYLIHYPYGCVEQTTSSFVPAVIAKKNPDIFKDSIDGKNINDIIKKGIERLAYLQQSDGGWGWWWQGESSNYFISAYVFEYLTEAKKAGFQIDDDMYGKATDFFKKDINLGDINGQNKALQERYARIAKIYTLSLIGDKAGKDKISDFENLSPDILSMAILSNIRNGHKNPADNGIAKLISLAKSQGEEIYWNAGEETAFGSIDSSTAFAVRALSSAGQNLDLAEKGVKYLMNQRKNEYWSSTFATAQVVRSFIDYARSKKEVDPSYSYVVDVDGKEIKNGRMEKFSQVDELTLPISDLSNENPKITIKKIGNGNIYSTLTVNEFKVEKNQSPVAHGLTVKRSYQNVTDPSREPKVGDVVRVDLDVSGLNMLRNYLVVEDKLPSGFIPVNSNLKNEAAIERNNKVGYYDYYDKEITKGGIIISDAWVNAGSNKYSYLARVVNAGSFSAPPARASLMYSPEVYGLSSTQNVISYNNVVSKAKPVGKTFSNILTKVSENYLKIIIIFFALIPIFVGGYFAVKKVKEKTNKKEEKENDIINLEK